jgi:hypothetical protein
MKRIAALAALLACFSPLIAGNGIPTNGELHVRVSGNCTKCERSADGSLTISCDQNASATCYYDTGKEVYVGCSCKTQSGSMFQSFTAAGGYDFQKTEDGGSIHRFSMTKISQ